MKENGKQEEAKYKFPNGKPIEFFTDDLEEFFGKPYISLDSFAHILKQSNQENLSMAGRILSDLLDYAEQEIEKKVKFIEENLGEIKVDSALYHQIGIAPETFLGVNFTAKHKAQV